MSMLRTGAAVTHLPGEPGTGKIGLHHPDPVLGTNRGSKGNDLHRILRQSQGLGNRIKESPPPGHSLRSAFVTAHKIIPNQGTNPVIRSISGVLEATLIHIPGKGTAILISLKNRRHKSGPVGILDTLDGAGVRLAVHDGTRDGNALVGTKITLKFTNRHH